MSKGTYSYSNRHRMHEPQVTNYDEVANLKGIIEELKRTLSKSMYALQDNERLERENAELRKDKSRLDWVQSSDLTLHSWEEGDVWARAGIYTIREYIDKQMEEAQ